jgi:hypothetical protein
MQVRVHLKLCFFCICLFVDRIDFRFFLFFSLHELLAGKSVDCLTPLFNLLQAHYDFIMYVHSSIACVQ